jgi:hypothetical protein
MERGRERWREREVGRGESGEVLFQVRMAALKRCQSIFRIYLKLNKFVVPLPSKFPQQTVFLGFEIKSVCVAKILVVKAFINC